MRHRPDLPEPLAIKDLRRKADLLVNRDLAALLSYADQLRAALAGAIRVPHLEDDQLDQMINAEFDNLSGYDRTALRRLLRAGIAAAARKQPQDRVGLSPMRQSYASGVNEGVVVGDLPTRPRPAIQG